MHQKADDSYETFTATADSRGDLTFGPLYELSPFMLVKGTLSINTLGVPDTGDMPIWLALAACALLAGGVAVMKKRKKV